MPRLEPIKINDACTGETIWLGAESDVWEAVRQEWGDDVTGVEADGWMTDVGWDRDTYDLKREFVQETGCSSFWEGCSGSRDGTESKKHRRAWRLIWAAPSEGDSK